MTFYTRLSDLLSQTGYMTIRLARSLAQQEILSESLQESRDRYQELVENLTEAIFTLDLDGVITYVSPIAEKLTGYHPSDTPRV